MATAPKKRGRPEGWTKPGGSRQRRDYRFTPDTLARIEQGRKLAASKDETDFVEQAIAHYVDHLARKNTPETSLENVGELRQEKPDGEKQTHACVLNPPTCPQTGDILAVQLFDGSEALVQVSGSAKCLEYPGYSKDQLRVTVLQATGPYGVLWYRDPTGERSTPYEYTLPIQSDPTYGLGWNTKPLNTYRILMWNELQTLTIIPLYRKLDAQWGAEYVKHTYEADQGRVVAALICLRDAGYWITESLKEPEPLQYNREIDRDHFRVFSPDDRWGPATERPAKVWTCQQIVAEALRLRAMQAVSEELALSA